MRDTRTWLRGLWQRVLDMLDIPTRPAAPPVDPPPPATEHVPVLPVLNLPVALDRHEVVESRAMWHATRYVEVIPGSGGRRWKPGTVQTQLIPAVPRDATEVLVERRPGWPQ